MKVQVGNVMNIEGVAEYTTLPKATIYNRVSNKTIPFHRVGSRTIFLQDEIDQWIKNDGQMNGNLPPINFFNN